MNVLSFALGQIPFILFSAMATLPLLYLRSRKLGCVAGMAIGSFFVFHSTNHGDVVLLRGFLMFVYFAIGGFIWGQIGAKEKNL